MELSRREKVFVGTGAGIAGVFVLVVFFLMPLFQLRTDLEASLSSKDAQLQRVYALSARIKALDAGKGRTPALRGADATLFGFLEQLASELKINERIEYMKPISETGGGARESVEVKIKGVFTEDLIGLLYRISSSAQPVHIKRLNIRRQDRENNLDITFQVVMYG